MGLGYIYIEDDRDRQDAARGLARALYDLRPLVVDTETTGLTSGAEICEIAIVDSATGEIIYDSLVRPRYRIPSGATRVHGITNEMVDDAPAWGEALLEVIARIEERGERPILTSYNWNYDRSLLIQSAHYAESSELHSDMVGKLAPKPPDLVDCIMEIYSLWHGDWHDYHKSYTWKGLDVAADDFEIANPRPHRAVGDALTALNVLRCMAEVWQ